MITMRKNKLYIRIITTMLLGITLFTGCGRSTSKYALNPKDPTTITIWHYYNGAQAIAFDNLVTEFNNTVGSKKGIQVESVSKSSVDDLTTAVTDAAEHKAGAEELPNMFQCYLDTAINLDSLSILTNLEPYLTDAEKEEYVESYLNEGIIGAKEELKLFPIAKSTELLAVNMTAFTPFAEETGLSLDDLATWEGIASVAEKYYTYSNGKSFFGRDSFANYMIIGSMQLGEEIFHVEKGEVSINLNQTAMRRLWDNYYIPYIKGYYQHVGRFRTDDIKTGTLIAAVGSNTGMAYLPDELTDANGNTVSASYQMLSVPNFEGTENYAVQQGASVAVTKANKTEEYASVTFLKWLTEDENNIELAVSSSYLPVKKSANNMSQINAFLEQTDATLTGLSYQAFATAIQQANEATLYTSNGFRKGYEARNLLNTSMIDLAMADREEVMKQIANGSSREDALAPYLTDEYFTQWYEDLKYQMDEICTE